MMEVYTPLIFPGDTQPQGTLEIYQYYEPTAQRIDSLRRWTFGSIGVGFGVLYASLLPLVWWSVRRTKVSLKAQVEEPIPSLAGSD